ncbi:TPA: hypothetical protein ACKP1B_005679 [Serratia fonticola]
MSPWLKKTTSNRYPIYIARYRLLIRQRLYQWINSQQRLPSSKKLMHSAKIFHRHIKEAGQVSTTFDITAFGVNLLMGVPQIG